LLAASNFITSVSIWWIGAFIGIELSNDLAKFEERKVHGDEDYSNDNSQYYDYEWLHEFTRDSCLVFYFGRVLQRHFIEENIELVHFLANPDHGYHFLWINAVVAKGLV
jgi:hypothetical protein